MQEIPMFLRIIISIVAMSIIGLACTKEEGGGRKDAAGEPQEQPVITDPCFDLLQDEEDDLDSVLEEASDEDSEDFPEDTPLEETPVDEGGEIVEDANIGTDGDCNKPTESFTEDDPPPSGGGGGKTDGPGYDECNGQGKAWIPVSGSGAYCGDTLASYCCVEEVVSQKFTNEQLYGKFAEFKNAGLSLYHCSVADDGKHTFHFAAKIDGITKYKNVWIKGSENEVEAPAECSPVTPDQMGFGGGDTPVDGDDPEVDAGEEDAGEEDAGETGDDETDPDDVIVDEGEVEI